MQNEDQSLRLKRRERQNQKLKKIFVAAGTAGLICGLLAGILITSVIAGFRANRTEEAFNQQLQTQKDQTSELETQFSQTAEARQAQIDNAPWNLKLVSEDHPLDESFEAELQELENEYEVDARIVDEAAEMLKAGRDEGLNLVIVSAYRDNERQQEIFNQTFQQWVSDGYT